MTFANPLNEQHGFESLDRLMKGVGTQGYGNEVVSWWHPPRRSAQNPPQELMRYSGREAGMGF